MVWQLKLCVNVIGHAPKHLPPLDSIVTVIKRVSMNDGVPHVGACSAWLCCNMRFVAGQGHANTYTCLWRYTQKHASIHLWTANMWEYTHARYCRSIKLSVNVFLHANWICVVTPCSIMLFLERVSLKDGSSKHAEACSAWLCCCMRCRAEQDQDHADHTTAQQPVPAPAAHLHSQCGQGREVCKHVWW